MSEYTEQMSTKEEFDEKVKSLKEHISDGEIEDAVTTFVVATVGDDEAMVVHAQGNLGDLAACIERIALGLPDGMRFLLGRAILDSVNIEAVPADEAELIRQEILNRTAPPVNKKLN